MKFKSLEELGCLLPEEQKKQAELKCSHKDAIKAYCRDWDRSGIAAPIAFAREVNKKGHVLNLKDSKK